MTLACAHTVLCEDCKEMDCKYNLAHAQALAQVVTTRISECQYVNATTRTTVAKQQKLQPRARGGTMSGTVKATPTKVVEFIVACIEHVKTESKGEYTGMHVKLSGFNAAFRAHFGVSTQDGIELVNIAVGTAKQKDGKTPVLYMRGAKGGPIIYMWADKPKSNGNGGALDSKAKGMLASVTGK